MVVVAIIGILNVILAPNIRKVQLRTRYTTLINDFRVFEEAFQRYAIENNGWPANYNVKKRRTPKGMEDYLPPSWGFQTRSPVGGVYSFEVDKKQKGTKTTAVIRVRDLNQNKLNLDKKDIAVLDEMFDDGNIKTGRIRLGKGNDPIWIIEE